ncbi:hypothetical protein AAFF_G00428810 [Aldrovandia affinis]|uniref:Uncharacterized protein n=1 Tax=Aldrovandia affinis TaxID=143900 RepID=A0AAD7S943_9TELE|nr:hypothetical protein AAFF_G00428810 [Aldrovandia affinis]
MTRVASRANSQLSDTVRARFLPSFSTPAAASRTEGWGEERRRGEEERTEVTVLPAHTVLPLHRAAETPSGKSLSRRQRSNHSRADFLKRQRTIPAPLPPSQLTA